MRKDLAKKEELFHPHEGGDKTISKPAKEGLPDTNFDPRRSRTTISPYPPSRYGFRSFDRQWIIPDSRLINLHPTVEWIFPPQVYLTAPEANPKIGPS